jgi:hypothetical protein
VTECCPQSEATAVRMLDAVITHMVQAMDLGMADKDWSGRADYTIDYAQAGHR